MKKISLYFLTAFTLSACGNELGSLSGGGVSLGGTGLPASGGNTTPLPSEEYNIDYIIWSKGIYTQSCDDLSISAYLIDSNTGKAIENSGHGTFIQKTDELNPTNLEILVTVKNNSLYPIYEYRNSCETPFQLQDQNQNIYEPQIDSSCISTSDEYQILSPSQIITYNLKYQIPQKFQNWSLNYNSLYSINQYSPIDQRNACSNFALDFSVEMM